MRCCDSPVPDEAVNGFKQMSPRVPVRKGPSAEWRRHILSDQQERCFYCKRRFGSTIWRGPKRVTLRLNWDHVSPWVYSLSNKDQNFVAACHVCNGIKRDMIFDSVEKALAYIDNRRTEKGYTDTPPLRELQRVIRETP